MEKAYKYQNEIIMIPNEEWCLSPGTPFSLQWDYYTHDKLENVLVSRHPTCRVTSPEIWAHKYGILVGNMHIDFRIKNTTWKMTSHECESHFRKRYSGEIIYNLDFGTY